MAKMMTPAMQRIAIKNEKYLKKGIKERKYSFMKDAWRRFRRNRTALIGLILVAIMILIGIFAGILSPYEYDAIDSTVMSQGPSLQHLFGTDNLGRDLFTRCMYGTRYSLPIAMASTLVCGFVGCMLGLVAAFFGGAVDNMIMRFMDILQAIPSILLAIAILAVAGSGIPQLIIALSFSGFASFAKMMRAAVFTVKGSEYVDACQSIGAGNMRLMVRHVFPNSFGHVIIFAVSHVAQGISSISALSYVGIGLQAPTPEWGSLLSTGRVYLSSAPHMVIFPGLMILITLLAFNLLGDGVRDALDPRLK